MIEEEIHTERLMDLWGDQVLDVLEDPESYRVVVASLNAEIRDVVCVDLMYQQLLNGGFWQYFYNPQGITINEAIQGAERMGLLELCNLAKSARESFGPEFPEDRFERMQIVGDWENRLMPFDEMDVAILALDQESIGETIDAYAAKALGLHEQ